MKLWGGRFEKTADALAHRFNASLAFDRRLYQEDIDGSIAWAGALQRAGLLTDKALSQIVQGLERVRVEIAAGELAWQEADEDIHTAVERRLIALIGPDGARLHTGRSRNDQVATDLRLYLLRQAAVLEGALVELQRAVVETAEAHLPLIMPGYTHLQPAQPLLFSHWLMSFFWRFQRDRERLAALGGRLSALPLGAGALAGTPFPIDRAALAEALGFEALCPNSVDAVSDRDFAVEFLAWAALTQVHLSQLAEDLVIWSSREFAFVALDQAHATGSSLMPQKKNPDPLELMRGKSGRMVGRLAGLLTTLKGLPSAYNKDLQEDKEALFDAVDTLGMELPLAAGLIRGLQVDGERMAAALDEGMLATDLADHLVRQGVPFRESHHLVGRAVVRAEALGLSLKTLPLEAYQAIDPRFDRTLYQVFDFRRSVEGRAVKGGTATAAVAAQIAGARELLARG